jgi:hypothetical protein
MLELGAVALCTLHSGQLVVRFGIVVETRLWHERVLGVLQCMSASIFTGVKPEQRL